MGNETIQIERDVEVVGWIRLDDHGKEVFVANSVSGKIVFKSTWKNQFIGLLNSTWL